MTKWEYEIIPLSGRIHTGSDLGSLSDMGKNGWELVSVVRGDYGDGRAFLKRPLRPDPPSLLVVNNIPGADFQQLIDSIRAELDRYWEAKEARRDPGT